MSERVRVMVGWDRYGRTGSRIGQDFTPPGCVTWTPVLWDDEDDPDWHKACGLVSIPADAPSSSGAPSIARRS